MARFDLEKLAEELAAKVRPDFEREIEKARAEGYRAGIEAAAKVARTSGLPEHERWKLSDAIRSLALPREPTPSPAAAPDDEVRDYPCECGGIFALDDDGCCQTCGVDWNYELALWQDGYGQGLKDFPPDAPASPMDTGGCGVTTTKEMPAGKGAPAAPKAPDEAGHPFVRCKRCGGSGRMGNPHIIDGWPVRCSECKGTGSAPPPHASPRWVKTMENRVDAPVAPKAPEPPPHDGEGA